MLFLEILEKLSVVFQENSIFFSAVEHSHLQYRRCGSARVESSRELICISFIVTFL